jgi:DNA-binding NarL/FixJ family response regulator
MINVMIADDQCMFREGLVAMLNNSSEYQVIAQAGSGEEALLQIERSKPDICILDVTLKGLCGIAVAQKLKSKSTRPKIIFVTTSTDVHTASLAIESGAAGYLLKNDAFDSLSKAIRTVSNDGNYITPLLAGDLLAYQNKRKDRKLSNREREVLYHISQGDSNKDIAKKLILSIKTVDTHRYRIMKKLNIHKTAGLVRIVCKEGVML